MDGIERNAQHQTDAKTIDAEIFLRWMEVCVGGSISSGFFGVRCKAGEGQMLTVLFGLWLTKSCAPTVPVRYLYPSRDLL